MSEKHPAWRLLILILALVILLEAWIWDWASGALRWIAARIPWQTIRTATKSIVNRLPAIFAVLLFGVPVVAMEAGSAMAVVMAALGHVIFGACLYALMKLIGVTLIAVIYDLTEEKLMTLPWFVWVHDKFHWLHEIAASFLAPYRDAALVMLRRWKARAAEVFRGWGLDFGRARREAQLQKTGAAKPNP